MATIIICFKIIDMNPHLKILSCLNLSRHFSLNVSRNQKKNHYDVLGITPKATQGDIKNSYYKLSKQYHPDTNSGNTSAADKFRDIAEAYEVLGNLKARKLYDRGIVIGDRLSDDSKSDDPVNEKYKHASFYHHRNKPKSTIKSAISGKLRHYDMDEWTKAHYSETLTSSFSKRRDGLHHVQDDAKTSAENKHIAQLTIVISLIVACGFIYGTDASRKYDIVNIDISEEKPD